ncbi:MAG: tRNA pseudouridine(38-40) synthase TruA [Eggerthellaceae bacterium]|nr:tRNA pseudouridine(38-40) synthase TruA [Eggerthellaceae bacterium]
MEDFCQHSLALEMSYDGSGFSGFAVQPGQHTVQGSLNDALELLYKRAIETVCAGRTDAGVHARRQVVSMNLSAEEFLVRDMVSLKRSLNALIDDKAVVTNIEERQAGFSARFDAKAREYRYFLSLSESRPILLNDWVWHLGKPLDIDAMRKGGAYLLGEHDFKSFCVSASAEGKPTRRKLIELSLEKEEFLAEEVVVIKVVGSSFLHSMVRTIVGTLVAVGLGKYPPEWVEQVLDARQRSAAGQTAPAKGLILWQVFY